LDGWRLLKKWQQMTLIEASTKGLTDKIDQLIIMMTSTSVNFDLQHWVGKSALVVASSDGNAEVAGTLIAAGAKLDMQNVGGNSALMLASMRGHTEAAGKLIAAGADLDL